MKKLTILFATLLLSLITTAQVKVTQLLCENRPDPVGLDVSIPRFSWQLQSEARNVSQSAYEIKVSSGKTVLWSTNKVVSSQSVMVPYAGAELQSAKKYQWQVRVWNQSGIASAWSAPASFVTGFFQKDNWKANWIEADFVEDSINRPAQYFRKLFIASKKIASATAFITSHGIYEAQLNGKRIGDAYLTPGWTSYKTRLQYQVYDVTNMLNQGANAIGVIVGNGWYRGFLAWGDNKNIYGNKLGVLCQLQITYTDGSTSTVVSDDSWKSAIGAIKAVEIYHGETYDATAEKQGWSTVSYSDADWAGVKTATYSFDNLIATYNEPVRKHETFSPVKIFTTPKGEKVIDFGQNLVGWVNLKTSGKAGDKITILHAEVLDKEGNFYIENLRAAKATATFILKGGERESLESHFTFYGFRYIKVEGYKGDLKPEDFTAVSLYSDMPQNGNFTSSNALINQLQHNIQWGQRGNFLDVPTDCPQRDERLGWTGDAQAFSRTASFNFGVNNFFAKWLKDISADQLPNGSVPFVVPNVLGAGASGSTGWADVATIIPWNMYLAYGDKRILENQYGSMKAWVDFMTKNSKNDLWNVGFHFGDWLFYRPFDDNDGSSAVTDKYLIAQCFYAHSTQLLINAANVLGNSADVAAYTTLLGKIKAAFLKEYMTANGRLVSGTQTAYVLALNFDMLPEGSRQQAVDRLVANIQQYGNHLSTGFLGTPYLCHVLSRFGKTDMAYTLLLQETYPSWLYPVKMGATTIWERWNGIRTDGSFEPASMNSFNHYAYGAIGDWMYRVVAGLDTYLDGPGYQHIKIQPVIGGTLTSAAATLKTYYGVAGSSWKLEGDNLLMDVTIPANAYATVHIPASGVDKITEGNQSIADNKSFPVTSSSNGVVVIELGSGTYHFSIAKK